MGGRGVTDTWRRTADTTNGGFRGALSSPSVWPSGRRGYMPLRIAAWKLIQR